MYMNGIMILRGQGPDGARVLGEQSLPPLNQKESAETVQTPGYFVSWIPHPPFHALSDFPKWKESQFWSRTVWIWVMKSGPHQSAITACQINVQEAIKRFIMPPHCSSFGTFSLFGWSRHTVFSAFDSLLSIWWLNTDWNVQMFLQDLHPVSEPQWPSCFYLRWRLLIFAVTPAIGNGWIVLRWGVYSVVQADPVIFSFFFFFLNFKIASLFDRRLQRGSSALPLPGVSLQHHIQFIVILLWRCYWWRSPLRLQLDIWIMSGCKQTCRSPPAAGCPRVYAFHIDAPN